MGEARTLSADPDCERALAGLLQFGALHTQARCSAASFFALRCADGREGERLHGTLPLFRGRAARSHGVPCTVSFLGSGYKGTLSVSLSARCLRSSRSSEVCQGRSTCRRSLSACKTSKRSTTVWATRRADEESGFCPGTSRLCGTASEDLCSLRDCSCAPGYAGGEKERADSTTI